jgi:predicted glycoside hydrolase/deacetylase ChbG (UPF0249 family)
VSALCLTADDYGLTAGVNAGIETLAAEGAITATSVMCHRDAVLDTTARLAGVATGIHLVFVEERPLTADAPFARDWKALFRRVLARPWLAARLADEARAQLARYRETGLPLHFVNSHQHVHLFPPIWAALAPVLRGLPGVRVRAPGRVSPFLWRASVRDLALSLSGRVSAALRGVGARRRLQPVGLGCAGHLTTSAAAERLVRAAAALHATDGDLAEIVTHPGSGDAETRARYPHWGYEWGAEHALLRGPDFRRAAAAASMSLEVPS